MRDLPFTDSCFLRELKKVITRIWLTHLIWIFLDVAGLLGSIS